MLPVNSGGTGSQAIAANSAVTMDSLGASMVGIPPGAAGSVIVSNGTRFVSGAGAAISYPINAVAKTGAYTAVPFTDYCIEYDCSAANGTLTVPAASAANQGAMLVVKLVAVTLGTYTLTLQTGITTTLNTAGETLSLISDGSVWQILNRRSDTSLTSYTPTITNGPTTSTATFFWSRTGDKATIFGNLIATAAGASGDLQISLPTGITFNTSVFTAGNNCVGTNYFIEVGTGTFTGAVVMTQGGVFQFVNGAINNFLLGSAFANTYALTFETIVPVLGWKG